MQGDDARLTPALDELDESIPGDVRDPYPEFARLREHSPVIRQESVYEGSFVSQSVAYSSQLATTPPYFLSPWLALTQTRDKESRATRVAGEVGARLG